MPPQTNTKKDKIQQMIFFEINMNNKSTCNIVCKVQCLKNGLQFIASDGTVNSIDFLDRDLLLIDLKLGVDIKQLKFLRKQEIFLNATLHFFTDVIIYQHFVHET